MVDKIKKEEIKEETKDKIISIDGKKIFKVYCEFFVKAKDDDEALDIVIDDFAGGDFFEEHIIIEESECKKEDIWNNEN